MDPVNVTWPQGADLTFSLVYKTGTVQSSTPVDLSTGYSLRMDIVSTANGALIYTFNTNDADPATVDEAVLGADGSINITVPRSLTLTGGPVFTQMNLATPVTTFNYDVFLRNPSGKQSKILKGMITVEPSVTLWL